MLRAHLPRHHQSQYFYPFPYHYTMSVIQPYLYQSSPLSMDNQPHIQANSAKRLLAEPGYLRRVIQDPHHQFSSLHVHIQPSAGQNINKIPLPSTAPHGGTRQAVFSLPAHHQRTRDRTGPLGPPSRGPWLAITGLRSDRRPSQGPRSGLYDYFRSQQSCSPCRTVAHSSSTLVTQLLALIDQYYSPLHGPASCTFYDFAGLHRPLACMARALDLRTPRYTT